MWPSAAPAAAERKALTQGWERAPLAPTGPAGETGKGESEKKMGRMGE